MGISDLNNVFGFTPEELALNMSGQLSPEQRKRLVQWRTSRKRTGLIAAVAVVLSMVLFVGVAVYRAGSRGETLFYTGIAAGLFILIYLVTTVITAIRCRDVVAGSISIAQGSCRLWKKQYRYGTGHFLAVGDKKFILTSPQQWKALEESRFIRVYYVKTPPVDIILSVEVTG